VIGGLLDELMQALPPGLGDGEGLSASGKKLLRLFPEKYLLVRPDEKLVTLEQAGKKEELMRRLTPYERTLAMTDYVSGMTDSYALELHQILTGVKLP
ncbi:MAG: hypothetical protein Q4C67_10710, partial [Deinococcus sp.]|nr:hypothetical protein [Deinococcus sp.]